MLRATGQSERRIQRRAQYALAALVLLLAGLFGSGMWAAVSYRVEDEWPALLIAFGSAAILTGGWLLARVPAEMRVLAEERRRALDDLLRAEELERERIATELHEDTIQVITAALVTIDRITPAVRAHDTERIARALPPTRAMLAHAGRPG